MLFYTSLAISCLIVAYLGLWIFRSFRAAGKAAHSAMLPSSKENVREEPEQQSEKLSKYENLKTPWGWKKGPKPEKRVVEKRLDRGGRKTGKSVPWGWPGSQKPLHQRHRVRDAIDQLHQQAEPVLQTMADSAGKFAGESAGNPSAGVDWPYRQDKFGLNGREFAVTQPKKSNKNRLHKVSKPWGW
jgi:hypothetical protein